MMRTASVFTDLRNVEPWKNINLSVLNSNDPCVCGQEKRLRREENIRRREENAKKAHRVQVVRFYQLARISNDFSLYVDHQYSQAEKNEQKAVAQYSKALVPQHEP